LPTPPGAHCRSELTIVLYDGDKTRDVPNFSARELIPIYEQEPLDTTDPKIRAELLELAADGIKALAEKERKKINQPKENA
jgi:hypothetical protein